MAGVTVPVVPMAHEYLITKPMGLPLEMPTMRDPSLLVYFRSEGAGLVAGGYERDPAPWGLEGIPADFNARLLEEDWDRFEPLMENAVRRVPALEDAEIVKLINGPEAFTPDGEFILGESDVRGFWVAAGFCAHGIAGAGGMGQLVAEWIVEGQPAFDVWEMDSRRFGRHYAGLEHRLARTVEVYATYYDVRYPGQERLAGRPLRVSPTYERLTALGASWGESERALAAEMLNRIAAETRARRIREVRFTADDAAEIARSAAERFVGTVLLDAGGTRGILHCPADTLFDLARFLRAEGAATVTAARLDYVFEAENPLLTSFLARLDKTGAP
jgi:glycine/D-amino acid oxidase-like deaminating enzyme